VTPGAALVALVTSVALAAGCGTDRPGGATDSPGDVAPVAADIDTSGVVAATVRLRSTGCGPRAELGTGTAIGDGLVVTVAHVVAGSDRVTAQHPDGTESEVEVVLFDPDLDLALVRLTRPPAANAAMRTEPATRGERGVIATFDSDGAAELVDVEVLRGVTIRTTDIYRATDVERPGIEITAAIEPGDSGAMVHLPGGGVGIVWSRSTLDPDRAWAVELPSFVLRDDERRALTRPVDTGPCP